MILSPLISLSISLFVLLLVSLLSQFQ